MNKKLLASIIGLSFCASAQAAVSVISDTTNAITLKVTESYTLGDNDTMTSAKDINLESAKKSASDYAGTYVESELEVSGNKITKQQIRILTAGFMEVKDRTNSRSIDKSGNIVLNTTANIRLSKESIRDGLAKLKSDPERKAKIKSLEADNKRLRDELVSLTRKINSDNSSTELMKARELVLDELDRNREATRQAFEQGTLFQLAMLEDNEYDLALDDLTMNVLNVFKNETKVTMGKPNFVKNKDGSFNVSVPVDWNLPTKSTLPTLSKYFKIDDFSRRCRRIKYSVCLSYYNNNDDRQKKPYTEKLLGALKSKVIAIEIDSKYGKGYLPISGELGHVGNDTYGFQHANDSKNKNLLSYSYRNPIIIRNLSESQLRSITSLNAKVVVMNKDDLYRWKYD
ncbi:hypothetical protein BIT28_24605 [Photobacterium proteolyticum]|uniref:Uncharacterized protein n=1 Tax=Photobacterium proteolyticum TaxID=1903952 RepID=A0A1Q9GCV0_9GAMM|nr:hypothetical protein [Photobacterium proteolyticum]OLQ72204.1 hypothetical protein BIT28_24605 [Photobacterium proteolyticum]